MYQRAKKSTGDGSPPNESIEAGKVSGADSGALRQSLPSREETAAIREHMEEAARRVDIRIRKGGLQLPPELALVAAALTALDLPVIGGATGFGSGAPRFAEDSGIKIRSNFPLIVIGESPRPFELRFSGHEESFKTELDSIPVPVTVRLRHPLTVGLNGLTPSNASLALDTEMKVKHPFLVEAIERAYYRSAIKASLTTPLENEVMRRECNVAIALRLKSYLHDFQTDHRASLGAPLTLLGARGEPSQLYAGNPLDTDPTVSDLSGNSLRSQIIGGRLSAMISFGAFLKERALRGD